MRRRDSLGAEPAHGRDSRDGGKQVSLKEFFTDPVCMGMVALIVIALVGMLLLDWFGDE